MHNILLFILSAHLLLAGTENHQPVWHLHDVRDRNDLRRLMASGARLEGRNEKGLTPLLSQATVGNLEMVDALLKIGAKIDARDRTGRTALLRAVDGMHGGIAMSEFLLGHGADIRARDRTADSGCEPGFRNCGYAEGARSPIVAAYR